LFLREQTANIPHFTNILQTFLLVLCKLLFFNKGETYC